MNTEMSVQLELGIVDAKFRVQREFEKFGDKIYLSFSGGKDSTVLGEIIKSCKLPINIPFVFANTGIELDATLNFVKSYDYENVQLVKPRKPAVKIWKDYGVPIKSKLKSEALNTYQNNIEDPLSKSRTRQLISGVREKGGIRSKGGTSYTLAKKDFFLLHEDLDYKVANMCCQYMKKYPFQDYAKDNEMLGSFTGIRTSEGGVRKLAYKSCVQVKKVGGKDFTMSMPIIDWTDEMVDEYIKVFNVKVSEAYTTYGLDRTGCMACPFAVNIRQDLEALYIFEPNKYKASMKMLKKVYMDSKVECDWDEEYMEEYRERWIKNDARNLEMLEKFSEELEVRTEFNKK